LRIKKRIFLERKRKTKNFVPEFLPLFPAAGKKIKRLEIPNGKET